MLENELAWYRANLLPRCRALIIRDNVRQELLLLGHGHRSAAGGLARGSGVGAITRRPAVQHCRRQQEGHISAVACRRDATPPPGDGSAEYPCPFPAQRPPWDGSDVVAEKNLSRFSSCLARTSCHRGGDIFPVPGRVVFKALFSAVWCATWGKVSLWNVAWSSKTSFR